MKKRVFAALIGLLLGGGTSPVFAQWQTQTLQLKPGWNAVYLHVEASYSSLNNLIPNADSPVAEIWLWKPASSTLQFANTPQNPITPSSQWAVWTANRADVDTLTTLIGNSAYLVRNSSSNAYNWTVRGKPLPPNYQWTTTGLNLIGFPTPLTSPPAFDRFLAPAPGLDLAKSQVNQSQVFAYFGGSLNTNPVPVTAQSARNVLVERGRAFWVSGSSNYYNHYYGPFETTLQTGGGLIFGDSAGVSTIRLKNVTDATRVVNFTVLGSEIPPAGQAVITGTPQLILQGARNPTNLTYGYSPLSGTQVTLAPQGQVGSEVPVVIGLNRTTMSGPAGSLYAGVLRLADADGLSQVDLPVSASVSSAAGLWVGDASVNQVGEYLKQYPRFDSTQPAPRASYLDLGSQGYGKLPAGVYFQNTGFTVESWFLARKFTSGARLFEFANAGGADAVYLTFAPQGQSTGQPAFGVARGFDVAPEVKASGNISTNTWVHLAIVQQPTSDGVNGTTTLYVNGVKQGEYSSLTPAAVLRTNCYLGLSYATNSPLLNGALDDFRIWSTARSADDIQRDMAQDNYAAGTAGLVVQYNFSTLANLGADSSGNGLSLALFSGAGGGTTSVSAADTYFANLDRAVTLGPNSPSGSENPGASWVPLGGVNGFNDIASSADGLKLIACGKYFMVKLSTDGGSTWANSMPYFYGEPSVVACSGSGAVLAVAWPYVGLFLSNDGGTNWVRREPGNQNWAAMAMSADGKRIVLAALGGNLMTSSDAGVTWATDGALRNWVAVASSGDGTNLVAAVQDGLLYTSNDGGKTWTSRESVRRWSTVASSNDGQNLVAAARGGQIFTSSDAGVTWVPRDSNRDWQRVAGSADGRQLVALVSSGNIYVSANAGASWFPQETARYWNAVASSADGTRLIASEFQGAVYQRIRSFVNYSLDSATGLIRGSDGSYISGGVNTRLASVPSPFPLRLLVHADTNNNVRLMQRLFVGPAAGGSSNTIIARTEALLDPTRIASARRLSAAHLPFSADNAYWQSGGSVVPNTTLVFNVRMDYNDQVNNPFLHTFHPDHDNLTADFKSVQPVGFESYGVTRQIKLNLTAPGNDFASVTASQLSRSGLYSETITLAGKAGASRQYRMAGTFTLRRISPIPMLKE